MTLVLDPSQIRELLRMDACIDQMAEALAALARGRATNPLRQAMALPDGRAVIGMMPGALAEPAVVGLKVVAIFPGNHGTRYDSHQGVVLLLDPDNGVPLVILDASEVTAIRTAAVSGLATRLLARRDAGNLALLGSGVQARTHLAAMLAVRALDRVRVFSPDPERRARFAQTESVRQGIEIEPVPSVEECVAGADLICTTTSAREPILLGDWIAPGCHINAVGACVPGSRELDSDAVLRSSVFVDSRESALNEAGDLLLPIREGLIDARFIRGELGELLTGACSGRESDDQITLFESLGLAVEDLAAAQHVLTRARAAGIGTEVGLGGLRD